MMHQEFEELAGYEVTAALSDLLQALAQSVESAERTARAVALAADRWQENLIHDDLMKIRYDLEDIRIRAISLSGDAFGHSAEAGRKARDLLAQADAAPQENCPPAHQQHNTQKGITS